MTSRFVYPLVLFIALVLGLSACAQVQKNMDNPSTNTTEWNPT